MKVRPARAGPLPWGAWPRYLLIVALAAAMAGALPPGSAAASNRAPALIVEDDRGGPVRARERKIRRLIRNGSRVEIRGSYCLSACTMYLAVRDLCVSRRTVFGFHGPSSPLYGIALPPESFERWSRLIAAHYPEPLRSWYLREGRNRTVGFYYLTGEQLIAMGIGECPAR